MSRVRQGRAGKAHLREQLQAQGFGLVRNGFQNRQEEKRRQPVLPARRPCPPETHAAPGCSASPRPQRRWRGARPVARARGVALDVPRRRRALARVRHARDADPGVAALPGDGGPSGRGGRGARAGRAGERDGRADRAARRRRVRPPQPPTRGARRSAGGRGGRRCNRGTGPSRKARRRR